MAAAGLPAWPLQAWSLVRQRFAHRNASASASALASLSPRGHAARQRAFAVMQAVALVGATVLRRAAPDCSVRRLALEAETAPCNNLALWVAQIVITPECCRLAGSGKAQHARGFQRDAETALAVHVSAELDGRVSRHRLRGFHPAGQDRSRFLHFDDDRDRRSAAGRHQLAGVRFAQREGRFGACRREQQGCNPADESGEWHRRGGQGGSARPIAIPAGSLANLRQSVRVDAEPVSGAALRIAARMPCSSAVGVGGQPGISTSTGMTLATRPREA